MDREKLTIELNKHWSNALKCKPCIVLFKNLNLLESPASDKHPGK